LNPPSSITDLWIQKRSNGCELRIRSDCNRASDKQSVGALRTFRALGGLNPISFFAKFKLRKG